MNYKIEHITAEISLKAYIAEYRDVDRFIALCRECRFFGKRWSCPPFDFFDTEEYLSGYQTCNILGTKITFDKTLLDTNFSDNEISETVKLMLAPVRQKEDALLLAREKQTPGSCAFFGGTCNICAEGQCTRIVGKECIHPDKMRHSLESLGFDIGKTASQLLGVPLKWGTQNRLPEYLLLVSALFTGRT